ncbi:unnamed protein product [Orchesella dallaii]|uniref:Guanylate cyclase n=1 Tax=Orchesella dallaii TaxID=48710 RepID=A0ABP1R9H7_9HEXA
MKTLAIIILSLLAVVPYCMTSIQTGSSAEELVQSPLSSAEAESSHLHFQDPSNVSIKESNLYQEYVEDVPTRNVDLYRNHHSHHYYGDTPVVLPEDVSSQQVADYMEQRQEAYLQAFDGPQLQPQENNTSKSSDNLKETLVLRSSRAEKNGGEVICTNSSTGKPSYGERLEDSKAWNFNSSTKCSNHLQTKNDSVITLGFLSPFNQNQFSLGALRLAVAEVNENPNLLPGRQLRYIAADIGSSDLLLTSRPIKIMTEMRDRGTVGFIGGPEDTCISEALVAAAWNLPMISYKCSDHRVSDKTTYTTFARTLPPSSKVSKSVVALLKTFNWYKIVLVVCHLKNDRSYNILIDAFTKLAEKENIDITDSYKLPDYIPENFGKMEDIVKESLPRTRVYVFIGEHVALVHLIQALANKRAFDNGEYIIISIDDKLDVSGKFFDVDYLEPFLRNSTDDMMKAYKSVLKLIPSPQTGYFGNDVKQLILNYSTESPFCVPFHPTIFKDAQVPIEAAYLYDAVIIYAHALHDLLKDGHDPLNGSALLERIQNRRYQSLQGYEVLIDNNGDAEGNYTVVSLLPVQDADSALNQSSSSLGPTYYYWDSNANTTVNLSMQPVGYFTQVPSNSSTSSTGNSESNGKREKPADDIVVFHYINESRQIQWVGGKPPKAEPRCGFHGEHCVYKPDWRTIVVCSVAALVVAVAFVIAARHYRYEQKLACLLWKIDMRDVILIPLGPPEPINGTKNTVALCRQLLGTAVDTEPPLELACKKAYTRIGFYKGMVVALKPIYKRSIDLTRNIRKELIQIREVRHENIIPFIGASVDHGNICILTAYSARGSLEDVLQNEDLHLDNMFLASLVADLIKGMIYLHDSEIISHGNLKSSNCLVDSRWVLQIADFGLHEFKAGQEIKGESENEVRKLLWKAPELLRDPSAPARGTQKGDVYSFGIILYEMIGRSGPWGKTQLSYSEIIEKVVNPELVDLSESEDGFLRPSTLHLDCGETILKCLQACWEEDADLRPDFRYIRVRLKEMQAGLKPNIFDNMLSIMEKYACNLEDLVQERTYQLIEEKKKTDALLHRMLPKSVAESLKRGDPVEAESFDSVTIYFSDIVGFTALSAVSTPLQVVELLNDLYTCFDSIISNYDVYKVETIGDAYMVVSGLPIRNGNHHAGEIASMALHLLDRIKSFEVRHRPGERLKLRIGIHTGCVVAGVVGLKMPRYCLFGDTVNTASRMESSGEALKIHISNVTKSVLEQIGGYYYDERGIIPIKGKGEMCTFWLTGEDPARTRKNSTESNVTNRLDVLEEKSMHQSPPNGVIGFGQGEPYNIDLSEVAAATNNNFQSFPCDDASECNANVNSNASSSPYNHQGNTSNYNKKVENSGDSRAGGEKPVVSREASPDLTTTIGSNKYDQSLNNLSAGSNGKVVYKPTTWLLADCQNGKIDHHGNVLKNIGGKYVSCSNVFQECKVNIIKELKKNGNTAAAAAAATAFACNNGSIGNHHLHHGQHPTTNRFRSAPIITFMETSSPNPTSTPLFAHEERNFV